MASSVGTLRAVMSITGFLGKWILLPMILMQVMAEWMHKQAPAWVYLWTGIGFVLASISLIVWAAISYLEEEGD